MRRLALRPFTFSNGVTVPAGTLVSVPASATHTDEEIYPNPDEFDGFRFAKLRESEGDKMTSRYQAVSTSSEHLTYGLGRHTWYAFCWRLMVHDLTRHYLLSAPDDSLQSMKSRVCLPISSRVMISSLRKGKGFLERFSSRESVFPGERM
jgi:hypothetical protein